MVFNTSFRQQTILRQAFRGFLGLTIATPVVAVLQGAYFLSDFRKNHRDAPFPEMPCSGVVVVHPKTIGSVSAAASSWFSSFPLLREQKDPDPLRLLVVGDSLAAGVGTTKQGTPVLPEAIAKSLSRELGGRAVHWTCLGEPGLSSPQIVKELLLAEVEDDEEDEPVDVMQELKGWWQEKRQQQQQQQQQLENSSKGDGEELPPKNPAKIREWLQDTKENVRQDVKDLKEKIHWRDLGKSVRNRLKKIPKNIPQPPVIMQRQNTAVPNLVAQYDVAVVVTGFNDIKNLIFPVPPPDPDEMNKKLLKKRVVVEEEENNSGGFLEKDLYRIMGALKRKMRNYDTKEEKLVEDDSQGDNEERNNDASTTNSSRLQRNEKIKGRLTHHPMVVFPANPLFVEKVYPLVWFAYPFIGFMEKQKKTLAESYPAPVLFVEGLDPKTISDYVNERGPYWEATKEEDVLLRVTSRAQQGLENMEKLMKEYYDTWTTDVEEEEPTYVYDVFGPDLEGPLGHLTGDIELKSANARSPLVSPDNVHPSDEGYELWGRHIANAIVKEWHKS